PETAEEFRCSHVRACAHPEKNSRVRVQAALPIPCKQQIARRLVWWLPASREFPPARRLPSGASAENQNQAPCRSGALRHCLQHYVQLEPKNAAHSES